MEKSFVGPQLRQLRRERSETQSQMAQKLGISAAYVNLLESNQRSLSVKVLVALTEAYDIDWRHFLPATNQDQLPQLRAMIRDPLFQGPPPDLQELRAALDHAPRLVERFAELYESHRRLADRLNTISGSTSVSDLLASSPEAAAQEVFRANNNHFDLLERAATELRERIGGAPDDLYAALKRHLRREHQMDAVMKTLAEMPDSLRQIKRDTAEVWLSEALDHTNRVFQLACVLGLIAYQDRVSAILDAAGLDDGDSRARLKVDLVNYFAAAFLMPYTRFRDMAEDTRYDIDRLASAFCVSFEQVCHRLTSLTRPDEAGVPFFFLRIDRAGNVTKRISVAGSALSQQGGSCPAWDIHGAFREPGIVKAQFVELPEGERAFTLARTSDRPVFNRQTQDRRMVVVLGCARSDAGRVVYADRFNLDAADPFVRVGINCHLCVRQSCSQRAHQPLTTRLTLDADKRGTTRYES